ncbi:M15 family metallopeptidase [Blautia sp. HCP3S3_D9]|uniref:M15 family metallopeptidase n=1 Tax=Blautia sp. HCP3S3_D9 TaxID=3438912 RepID=UPI003F894DC5
MLEKRKRRVKFIILTVLCVVLAGVSVVEGILYLQTRRNYDYLQSQKTEIKQKYKAANSQLKEKDDKITQLEQDVEDLKQQVQTLQQTQTEAVQQNEEAQAVESQTETTQEEGMLSPSSGNSAFLDVQLRAGEAISDDEIINIDKYFTSSVIERGDAVFNRINGKSYRDNNDIALEDLRYLTIPYYNFEQQVMLGEMIVNVDIQEDVLNIFKELFNNKYEINSMKLIDDYWILGTDGNKADNNSIEENNTSCFCYRQVTGGESISNHGYGRAIDINPQQNPYVENGKNSHRNADEYVNNRYVGEPHVIVASDEDICYSIFTKYGFTWGGNWTNPIDYQHFEKAVAY